MYSSLYNIITLMDLFIIKKRMFKMYDYNIYYIKSN